MVKANMDSDLFERFRRGETEAFSQVHKLFFAPINRFAKKIVGELEASDLVSETFYKLITSHKNFKDLNHVENYLYQVTKRSAIDFLRKKDRVRLSKIELLYLSDEEENAIDLERQMSKYLHQLYEEIEKLPNQSKDVIKLILRGHNTKFIAETMDIAPRTVLNYKTSAIKTLKRKFLVGNHFLSEIAIIFLIISIYIPVTFPLREFDKGLPISILNFPSKLYLSFQPEKT